MNEAIPSVPPGNEEESGPVTTPPSVHVAACTHKSPLHDSHARAFRAVLVITVVFIKSTGKTDAIDCIVDVEGTDV